MRAIGATRFDLKYSNGTLPHEAMMGSIERYATEVVPRVRELLAAAPTPTPTPSSTSSPRPIERMPRPPPSTRRLIARGRPGGVTRAERHVGARPRAARRHVGARPRGTTRHRAAVARNVPAMIVMST